MYFPNYGLPKARLGKYQKSAVSQYPSKGNMLNALKHTSSHRGGTYIKLIDYR